MLVTYFILKLTFQAIVEESNRLAAEAESNERARWLKSKVVQLDIDYSTGEIDEDDYARRQSEILEELRKLSAASQTGSSN